MKTFRGRIGARFQHILGEVTLRAHPFYDRTRFILATESFGLHSLGYAGCLTRGAKGRFWQPCTIYGIVDEAWKTLHEGDIISMDGNGTVSIVWEQGAPHNALMATEACNCRCLMCPQPPSVHHPALLKTAHRILDLLKGKAQPSLCITGGEPTLLKNDFLLLLHRCRTEHPEALISILTNAKAMDDADFARQSVYAAGENAIFCVSMHSDVDTIHDTIVGKIGSFSAGQAGIYNLAQYGARLEIRHVITKLNFTRLPYFAEHLYNYLPFCAHYAFMGMELCGLAMQNKDLVYVEPPVYANELEKAVLFMNMRGMPVSVYNIPLCMCTERVRPFARQSISSWKNVYASACSGCSRREECAGFFSTSGILPQEHVKPFKEEV